MPVTHNKVNNIPDLTQAELDAQIARGNFPAGTTLNDITLASDWNEEHVVSGLTTAEFASQNVSQWTNDAGYLSSVSGNWTGTFDGQEGSWYRDRANHTGTQTASTISDFDSAADARITAQKGAADGIAPLGADTKIPTSYLPAIALTDVFVVNSQAAQLALTAEEGDVAVRTDLNKSYIHNGGSAGTMADWQELLAPTDAVLSVNGFTGAVTITTTNVAEGSNLYYTDERAQDAVGNAVGTGLDYADASGAISVDETELNHNILANLATGDVHTQYALLVGRATPQQFAFGSDASASTGYLTSTAHATKGKYFLNAAGTMAVDELNVRLGIGQPTPTVAVDVLGTDFLSSSMRFTRTGTGANDFAAINLVRENGAGDATKLGAFQFIRIDSGGTYDIGASIRAIINGTPSDTSLPTDLQFFTAASGTTLTNASAPRVTIASTGHVSIGGATAPAYRLDVQGSGGTTLDTLRLSSNATDNANKVGGMVGRHYDIDEEDTLSFWHSNISTGNRIVFGGGASGFNAATDVIFYTAANNTTLVGTERMRISPDGNLGIGTSTFGTSAAGVIGIANGTAPSSSPADIVQIWAQDTVAGQSNLYARNENGKSQQLTGTRDMVSTQFDKTNTTLADITGLSHNVEAGKRYAFRAVLYTTSNVSGGVKASIAGTATATSVIYEGEVHQAGVLVAPGTSRATALATTVANVTAVTAATIIIEGSITVNAAGTLTVQFAENAAVGTSSVLVGSYFEVIPIGD